MPKNFKVTTKMPPVPHLDRGALDLFDQNNNDLNLFNLIDQEIIQLAGADILVYKYFRSDNHDDVYGEERNKVISKEGILVVGQYEPKPMEENLSEFGIEISNDQIFTFNKSYIEQKLGRGFIPGDVLKPKFQNIKYKVIESQEDSFAIFGVYHLVVTAKILRDSDDVMDLPTT